LVEGCDKIFGVDIGDGNGYGFGGSEGSIAGGYGDVIDVIGSCIRRTFVVGSGFEGD
jgi:hypothetical protein